MMGKLLALVMVACIAAVAYSQLPELRRYMKIRQM
jgi:hypothetical protein